MSGDYLSFLQEEAIPAKYKQAAENASLVEAILQSAKNSSAPTISGGSVNYNRGSSGGGGSSSANVPVGALPKMKGGKVLPTGARISQNWGASKIKYAAGRHTGMDFGGPVGTRIGAAAAGVVVRAGREGAYGNAIHVKHADGKTTLYAHLSGISVKPGQKVKAGQQIGKMGSTGRSTGSHLHFEVRKSDKYGSDINPRSWFSTR